MRYVPVLAAFVVAWACLSQPAAAAVDAYASQELNVRAGPGGGYPLIGSIPENTLVDVQACNEGMRWCDVMTSGFRGWVSADDLNVSSNNGPSTIIDIGAALGLPTVSFDEHTYWVNNYSDRDIYQNRYGHNDGYARYGLRREGNHWVHTQNWTEMDMDGDGLVNSEDTDDDGDGISDKHDLDRDNDHFVDLWNRSDLHSRRYDYRD